jgi:hypothetical protein
MFGRLVLSVSLILLVATLVLRSIAMRPRPAWSRARFKEANC